MKHPERSLAWITLCGLAAIALTMSAAGRALAAQPGDTSGSTVSKTAVAPNPAFDRRLCGFLQRRFLIADPNHVRLGPMTRVAMPGMFERQIKLTNDKGQSIKAEVFSDAAGKQVIVGSLLDLTKDPWQHVDLSKLHLADRPILGPADAPVTVVEFADFECPYCAHAFSVLETMVHTTYKGKVRVIFKNFPLNSHPWAVRAAVAADCARLQNPKAFWSFAREFYTSQGLITPKNLDTYINQTATRLGLDTGLLDACVRNRSSLERVAQDEADGHAVGVISTPTFFINGVKVVGLPDETAFNFVVRTQIEEASGHAGN